MECHFHTIHCPRCNKIIWDHATVDQRLNKCWECGLRFDQEEYEVDEVPEQPRCTRTYTKGPVTYKDVCKILAAKRCRAAGVSVRVIAQQAHVSRGTVYRWLKV